LFSSGEKLIDKIKLPGVAGTDTSFTLFLNNFFLLAPWIAAQPQQRDSFVNFYNKIRSEVKLQSQSWDINDIRVRNSLYQLLWHAGGGRRSIIANSIRSL
jgi:hypothetical protein